MDLIFILNIFVTQNLSVVAIFGFEKMKSGLTKHLIFCGSHKNENARFLYPFNARR